MLKYKIKTDDFFNNSNSIDIVSCTLNELLGEMGEKYSMVTCFCNDISNIFTNTKLLSVNTVNVIYEKYAELNNQYEVNNIVNVKGVNNVEKSFTFLIEKVKELALKNISWQYPYDNGKKTTDSYLYFYFEDTHFYNNPNIDSNQDIVLYVEYFNKDNVLQVETLNCEYISLDILRIKTNDIKDDLITLLFNNKPSTDTVGYKEKISVFRNNYLFDTFKKDETTFIDVTKFKLYYDRPLQKFMIPFSQKFETNMYQSDALQTNFVEYEKEKAINKITDMEKDVYHPVIMLNGQTKPVFEIVFNLHFREHRGNDWTVNPNSYWNGTYINDSGDLKPMETSDQADYAYFSYGKSGWNRSDQSDLLSYLNFTNEDIRYQKNKMKKSFLRLSFYDSTNPSNQNLVYYSTIFMDTGLLFSKYVKHIEDEKYSMIIYDDKTNVYENTRQNLTGIRNNREPYDTILNDYKDNMEEIRLSSQFIVKDKYNSTSSCEGFYIYLWRDYDNGVMPTDLYMKVEFNHAGYGRTIPFMMPSDDDNKNKIKTFEEIIDDWNPNVALNEEIGYGIKKYLKYSYIHLKYKYDKDNKQHIYYVDDEYYSNIKDSIYNIDNVIKFDLYEAKISNGGRVDEQTDFSADPRSNTFSVNGEEEMAVNVTSEDDKGVFLPYSISKNGDWFTITKVGNNFKVVVSSANNSYRKKYGKITLTQSKTNKIIIINIEQEAKADETVF